jgi:hypothetical protein
MKTTYITFTREMARAYAEGRKRMTRRVIKPPFEILANGYITRRRGNERFCPYPCPYGKRGDQIILGTTWAVPECYDHLKPTELPKYEGTGLHDCMPIDIWSYFDSDEKPEGFGKLRPGRFLPGFLRDRMPCVTMKIVRAERVQDITEEDALLEGIIKLDHGYFSERTDAKYDSSLSTARLAFANLINRIHGGKNWNLYYNDDKLEKPIWDKNPWVWVLRW